MFIDSHAATSGPLATGGTPLLAIRDLNVHYGLAHAVQDVSLTLAQGVLAVVGRNGMGKSSLCNAITSMVRSSGSIRLNGQEIRGFARHRLAHLGIAYVPQGRRIWSSLSVHEHLQLTSGSARRGDWTVQRVYEAFPRLAQRRNNGGSQLSGGEQQMLAIGRALLLNPCLLVMDEPTEGLAPVILDHVAAMLKALAAEGKIAVLLIEQNIGVAMDIADSVAVMVNGRVARVLPANELAADRALQQELLGLKGGARTSAAGAAAASEPHGDPLAGATSSGLGTGAGTDPQPGSRQTVAQASKDKVAYIAGTFDTKGRELMYMRDCLSRFDLRTRTVDLSTSGAESPADVSPREVARHHPAGVEAVFTNDRGTAVSAMAEAFERYIQTCSDVAGLVSAGGSGGTALATPAMRALPIGVPKLMLSTVASGDTRPYVGPSDICMMYSVTDVQGINGISQLVLANAANALGGMISHAPRAVAATKPAIGLTMFGVTTPCVQAVTAALEKDYDCLVFHATGTGGQSMEKLADSRLLAGVIDATTTEVADELLGGVFSAGPGRLDAIARSRVPYVGSCGALDMVNFGALDSVPPHYRHRNLYQHNANVTLMRTSIEDNVAIGKFIAGKLNRMTGPVRFFLPEGGVSMLDAPGAQFWNPEADKALFDAIEAHFQAAPMRQLVRTPLHINDPKFADLLVQAFTELSATPS